MVGSGAVAAWIAQGAFWVILILGVAYGEIGRRGCTIFCLLWALGSFGLPRLSAFSGLYVTPYVAVLDIVLAFIVFKGDVRLN
jgi:hypothetical protein